MKPTRSTSTSFKKKLFSSFNFAQQVMLSHKAILEIERSITDPSKGTEHFSTMVIQNFNAPVGAVQTAPNSTANVNQNFGTSMAEVTELIGQLRAQFETLPHGSRE